MWDVLVPMALSVLLALIKKPETAAAFRAGLVKLRNALVAMNLDERQFSIFAKDD
jgi:hypothetical protein